MANAPVVVSDATTTAAGQARRGTLFVGLSFFLVQRLPLRGQLISDIEANGGRVVKLEKQADYVIADHARRDAPSGSYSWTLITTAIRDGALPADVIDHRAGPRPGTVRDVGSGIPVKTTRTAFTLDDDRELWLWVEQEKARGGMIKGNDIYKGLEQRNPRHTFQAWRDRYIKKLIHSPPAGVDLSVPANPPPTPPTAPDAQEDFPTPPAKRCKVRAGDAQRDGAGSANSKALMRGQEKNEQDARDQEKEDFDLLLGQAEDIEKISDDAHEKAWEAWWQAFPHLSVHQWTKLWHEKVRPFWQAQCELQKAIEQSKREMPTVKHSTRKRKRYLDTGSTGSDRDAPIESALPHSGRIAKRDGADMKVVEDTQFAFGSSEGGRVVVPKSSQQGSTRGKDSVELLTSEANQGANNQIIREVSAAYNTPVNHVAKWPSEDPQQYAGNKVSEVDDGKYDTQPRNVPAAEPQQAANLESPDEIVQAASQQLLTMGEDVSSEVESSALSACSQVDAQLKTSPRRIDGTALTEANLAAQEARHNAPLRRGIDLPEDDPNNDQSDLLQFLQDAVNGRQAPERFRAEPLVGPHDRHLMTNVPATDISEHSSHEDLVEVIRSNLEWPLSPQQSKTVASSMLTRAAKGPSAAEESHSIRVARHDDHSNYVNPEPQNGTPHPTRHSKLESERGVDLTVAFPEISGGSDPSSDRQSPLFMPEGSPELVGHSTHTHRAVSGEHEAPKGAADIIEISSASPSSSSIESSVHSHGLQQHSHSAYAGRALETQDIFSADIQHPDLSMPLPPDSDDAGGDEKEYEVGREDNVAYERDTKSPSMASAPEDEATRLETWMSTMEVRGHEEHLIIEALKRTSMRLDLAELVLVYIKSGKGIPVDVPGIWADEEDEQLEGGNAKAIRLLEAKHGWDACKARLRYLEEYREGD